ncbi:zinc ion binding, partial [Striga hermonthica]
GITGTGQGFDLPGRKLGGYSHQPPLSSLRQKALTAAQNRAKLEALLPHGPKRIGGDSSIKSMLSPIQAAAMAAERRLHDDLWCGSKSGHENEGSFGNTSSVNDVGPDLISQKDEMLWQCNACTLLNRRLALACEACGTQKGEDNGSKKTKVWSCKFCTLNNGIEIERCTACGEWRYSYGPPVSTTGPYHGT